MGEPGHHEKLCPFCRTTQAYVTFERLDVEVWPEGRDICGECFEQYQAELEHDAVERLPVAEQLGA
jgi:hypothetical protein